MIRIKMSIIPFIIAVLTIIFLSLNISYARGEKRFIKVGGTVPAGGSHMVCAKMADLIDRYIEGVTSNVTTGGSAINPVKVQNKEVDLAFTNVAVQKAAYKGIGKFKDKPCPDIRFLCNVITVANAVWFVRADSKINSISDLYNKRVCLGPKGYIGVRVAEAYLKAYGITRESIKSHGGVPSLLGSNDAGRMMQDKNLDAMAATSGLTAVEGYMLPIEETIGLRILKPDAAHLQKALSYLPPSFFPVTVKGGSYRHEPDNMRLIGTSFSMVIHKDISDEMVYKILSIFYGHLDEVQAVTPTAKDITLEIAFNYANIPVHPGAMKFFKEKGVKGKTGN